MTSVLTDDVEAAARFYEALLGMTRLGDFGWFIVLGHDGVAGLELGFLQRDHETVPAALAREPAGVILTFVVNDVSVAFANAQSMGVEILQPPTDLPYGQRRLLVRDPAGTTVDISSPTP
ncbi:MAG: VOC family protein [Pseudomonadota bacterium]